MVYENYWAVIIVSFSGRAESDDVLGADLTGELNYVYMHFNFSFWTALAYN